MLQYRHASSMHDKTARAASAHDMQQIIVAGYTVRRVLHMSCKSAALLTFGMAMHPQTLL